jgi:uncharacterized membrane protein YfcA
MSPLQAVAVLLAGAVAGAMNAVVGGGTLVSFPALLAVGLPPVTANVSNSLGVLPGSVAGAYAYRHQLGPLRHVLRPALPTALVGGAAGAALLLVLPASVFEAAVPVLLLVAAAAVVLQPRISRWVDERWVDERWVDERWVDERWVDERWVDERWVDERRVDERRPEPGADEPHALSAWVTGSVLLVSVYGGYFGAGVSVMFLAVLGVLLGGLQRANGAKNLLSAASGLAAAAVFVARAPVDWPAVVLLAVGSAAGGLLGGRYGRRLPDTALRTFVVALAVVVAARQAFAGG